MTLMGRQAKFPPAIIVEPTTLAGRPGETLVASHAGPHVLYIHGGGYVAGSPASHRHLGGLLAAEIAGVVHMVDYRLAPEEPCPAAIEDCASAYRELTLRHPDRLIALAGDSAGGGLALLTALDARDCGERLPSSIVLLSPWIDQTLLAETFHAPIERDPTLSKAALEWYASCYRPQYAADDVLVSPIFADLRGLPPIMIQAGEREVLVDDARKLHELLGAAGSPTELSVWPDMFHAWHLFWPWLTPGQHAVAEAARFIRRHALDS